MNRMRSLFLLLILSLLLSGYAGYGEEPVLQSPSVYSSSAPMSEYATLFTETELFGSAPLNRAAAAVILARCANGENTLGGSVSADVDPSAWLAAGRKWAGTHSGIPRDADCLCHPDQGMHRE